MGSFRLGTVTLTLAVLLPHSVVTVTVAVPALRAVILPELSTRTIFAFEVLHVTFLFVAFEGATVAVNVLEAPVASVRAVGVSVTPVTGTFGARKPQLSAVPVMICVAWRVEGSKRNR